MRVTLLRVCVCFNRRSYVGVELVQWLCEQCLYVRCRTAAVRVWQVLLELGVLLSGKAHALHSDTSGGYTAESATVIGSRHLQWLLHCKVANIELALQIICEKNGSTASPPPLSSWSKMTQSLWVFIPFNYNKLCLY